jgi:hypothetical protein
MAEISDFDNDPDTRILIEMFIAREIDNSVDFILLENGTYILLEDELSALQQEVI